MSEFITYTKKLPVKKSYDVIVCGGGLAGVLGMLCGVPIAAAIYRLLREEMGRRLYMNY